jgi:hypothetical protein
MNFGMDLIEFNWMGLSLQEPMALITNWILASFSFFAFSRLEKGVSRFQDLWKMFYLILGISMLFGGLGHFFFQYSGIPGKFPSWTLGVIAGVYASFAMISLMQHNKVRKILQVFVILKSAILLLTAFLTMKFLFVAIDTSVTYLIFCGYLAFRLDRRNWEGIKFIYLGVLVLIPSAIIFGLQINLHRWLNKDDLSHLLMLGCIIFFFLGVRATQKTNEHRLTK